MNRRQKLRQQAERKEDIVEICKIALGAIALALGGIAIYILL